MKELRTEIEIQTSPDRVWNVLTCLDKYSEWNPFILHAIGNAKLGGKVDIFIKSEKNEMTLHCKIIKVEPNKELCWKYYVLLPILFSGEHSFIIEQVDDSKIRFIDRELFRGLLVPSQSKDIDTNTRKGFEAMDLALKSRAELNQ